MMSNSLIYRHCLRTHLANVSSQATPGHIWVTHGNRAAQFSNLGSGPLCIPGSDPGAIHPGPRKLDRPNKQQPTLNEAEGCCLTLQ
jgi:hypothetical protein